MIAVEFRPHVDYLGVVRHVVSLERSMNIAEQDKLKESPFKDGTGGEF